jgi:hypothetical protein
MSIWVCLSALLLLLLILPSVFDATLRLMLRIGFLLMQALVQVLQVAVVLVGFLIVGPFLLMFLREDNVTMERAARVAATAGRSSRSSQTDSWRRWR